MIRTIVLIAITLFTSSARAQLGPGLPAPSPSSPTLTTPSSDISSMNPLVALQSAGDAMSTNRSGAPGTEQSGLSVALNIMLLLTVVALVPSIMLMTTSFVRIMVVLALLRQALGTQSLPPSQVITALALFMTAMVMKPTIDRVWDQAVVPYQSGEVRNLDELWVRASEPMRDFMFDQIEATDNWSSLYMILNYQGVDTTEPQNLTRADVPTTTLVPAYMLSELKVAFLMGFRVYLPFLVIDMVIASLLISMSMMMLPPVLISLPFKLMLFVLVDGWSLVVGSLLESFVTNGASPGLSAQQGMILLPIILIAQLRAHGSEGELVYERKSPLARLLTRGTRDAR